MNKLNWIKYLNGKWNKKADIRIQFFQFCFQQVELKEKQKCEMRLHPQNACIFYNISVNVCLSK